MASAFVSCESSSLPAAVGFSPSWEERTEEVMEELPLADRCLDSISVMTEEMRL